MYTIVRSVICTVGSLVGILLAAVQLIKIDRHLGSGGIFIMGRVYYVNKPHLLNTCICT